MSSRTVVVAVGAGAAVAGLLVGLLCRSRKREAALKAGRITLKLTQVRVLNHNSRVFTFALPSPEHVLGLPTGKHVSLSFKDAAGKLVSRAYTPLSNDASHVGVVDLAVKVYPDGKMTQHLEQLPINQTITFAGPKGEFEYLGRGRVKLTKKGFPPTVVVSSFSMLAGGSGITPIFQVLDAIVRDPNDKTKAYLIYANQTEDDILLKTELEAFQRAKPDQIKIWYTINTAGPEWQQGVGFITEEMMREHLGPKDDAMVLMCGPPPMLKFACNPNLDKIGWEPTQRFTF